MPKTITFAQLRKAEVCQEHLDQFRKTFGEEVTVSHDIVPQIVGLGFDINYIAFYLLKKRVLKEVYDEAVKHAYGVAFKAAIGPATIAYDAALAGVYEDGYYAALEAAEVAYKVATAPACEVFNLIKAHAFVDAYLAS